MCLLSQVREPSKRASLREALAHPWILKHAQQQPLSHIAARVQRSNTLMELKSSKSTPGYTQLTSMAPGKVG